MDKEATQVEINPFALDRKTGKYFFVDAKINIDDCSLFR
jgi:succinyl-CoA synthetase beta subunit